MVPSVEPRPWAWQLLTNSEANRIRFGMPVGYVTLKGYCLQAKLKDHIHCDIRFGRTKLFFLHHIEEAGEFPVHCSFTDCWATQWDAVNPQLQRMGGVSYVFV